MMTPFETIERYDMADTLIGDDLPAFDESYLNSLTMLSGEQLGNHFSELTEMAAQQPDDEAAFTELRMIFDEVRMRGEIDMAMYMAMTLGAMACLDPHFESIAGETLDYVTSRKHDEDRKSHDKDSNKDTAMHDSKKCSTCRAGRPCRRAI